MTEQEWLACDDPQKMLEFLQGKVSERKLRLFAVACGRRIDGIADDRLRHAIMVAEKHADGLATDDELADAHEECAKGRERDEVAIRLQRASVDLTCHPGLRLEVHSSRSPVVVSVPGSTSHANYAAQNAALHATCAVSEVARQQGGMAAWNSRSVTERSAQVALIKDVFGNPFRPVTVDPLWQTATVVALAQAIYDERAFDRLPILADALEDAGCTNAAILAHCRGPDLHVRGCWVLDLLLGKE